jgi:glycogen phosphorylase
LKENPDLDITPRVFIFGAKAAPSYYFAKSVINVINEVGNLVNNAKH